MKTAQDIKVAQYWNDIAQDFDAIYTGQNKSSFARTLDRWLRKDIYGRFDWVMRKSGDVNGKTICDIGCGSGRFVTSLAKRGASRVLGVDVAPEMLKLARELARQEGVGGRTEFAQMDIIDWTRTDVFDETIAIGFWDYFANPTERLQIIRKMTRERFLSAWPRLWTWRAPVRKVRLTVLGCPVYFFSKSEVYRYLEATGFKVISCETVGKLHCVDAVPV
ncbi:MAG TPA: methyltransferase domain-containing protein [Gemmatimonadaceae bacterium]|jgi:SAM-dependent methyltransferase